MAEEEIATYNIPIPSTPADRPQHTIVGALIRVFRNIRIVMAIDRQGRLHPTVDTSGRAAVDICAETANFLSHCRSTGASIYDKTKAAVDTADDPGSGVILKGRGSIYVPIVITFTGSPVTVSLRLALEDTDGVSGNWWQIYRPVDLTAADNKLICVYPTEGIVSETLTASSLATAAATVVSRAGTCLGAQVRLNVRLAMLSGGTNPTVRVQAWLVEA